jgi:NAD(P)-dependent dehydrogenase (short-subunit alcohol dehydrogenase family)
MILAGRRAVITGASQGFGRELAEAFVREGADVVLCARDAGALNAVVEALRAAYPGRRVTGVRADVGSEADVDALFGSAHAAFGDADVVVINAGVYGPKGSIGDIDWADWVDAIRINLLGAVYTARCALVPLRRAGHGKILILSGGGATKPLPNVSAYAASKAGLVRFGETLAEEVRGEGIDVNMIAPGALNTRLLDEILQAGPDVVGADFYAQAQRQAESGGTPLALGVALSVFLASTASDGITGKLISAQWDPWQQFAENKSRLDGDVYTLRRIVPEERGWSW